MTWRADPPYLNMFKKVLDRPPVQALYGACSKAGPAMKIVIPGGSGHIGGILARSFEREGHEVVILTRGSKVSAGRAVGWDGRTLGAWTSELAGADVVINLAGRNVNCRYNPRNRADIMASRVDSTRVIGEAIARSIWPPRLWLQTSTATIYAHRFDAPNDEQSGIVGG